MNRFEFIKKAKALSRITKTNSAINQKVEILFKLTLAPVAMTVDILKSLFFIVFWVPSLCCLILYLIWLPARSSKDKLIEFFARKYVGIKNPSVMKVKQYRRIKNQLMK